MPYKDPEAEKERYRRYYWANREAQRERSRQYYHSHKGSKRVQTSARNSRLKKYGLTADEFQVQLEAQDNKCGLCRTPFVKTPHVDHNHTTNKNRALLCHNCNVGLGHFSEDPKLLIAAVAYLEAWARPISTRHDEAGDLSDRV